MRAILPILPIYLITVLLVLFPMAGASPARVLAQTEWRAPDEARALENPVKGVGDIAGEIQARCAGCHGPKGEGDGPGLAYFKLSKPADWSSPQVQQQTDGELFWKISNGRLGAMPSNQGLSEVERWQMVNFIRMLGRN